jgi:SAM-dependent MidA family methyltransferase
MRAGLAADGGWWSFERFMEAALYTPGLGYYSSGRRVLGLGPQDGSDFSTAPEMSPLFARCLARQVQQLLQASDTRAIWEFGAGSGALAAGLLDALPGVEYHIVELSASLAQTQQQRLRSHADRTHWHKELPDHFNGIVIGNEVLDAMPVRLAHWTGSQWLERGVIFSVDEARWNWHDRDTGMGTPPADGPWGVGTVTEHHVASEAWTRSVGQRLQRGALLLIDYGFPAAEYYHPQRRQGTLICHRQHRSDSEPLLDVGEKDITAHVNFSGIADAGLDVGLELLGYTSQARFLINCGIGDALRACSLPQQIMAQRLVSEHEMGELFKVIAFSSSGLEVDAIGFQLGDRSHRL